MHETIRETKLPGILPGGQSAAGHEAGGPREGETKGASQAGGPPTGAPASGGPSVAPQASGGLPGGLESSAPPGMAASQEEVPHLRVEMDEAGHPRLRFLEGEQTVKVVVLNQQSFNGLIEQGLIRKPGSLEVGALRNWVKLDGELFRFDGEGNGMAGLEEALNDRYVLPDESCGENVLVFPNPASPTGFDLQFPASPLGFAENRRRHLNQETVGILRDSQKCRVLRKGISVVLAPPQLVFKRRQAEGNEVHLEAGPQSQVPLADGRVLDLSQPLDLLHLKAEDLAAVLNHPAVNRQAALAQLAATRQKGGQERREAA